MLYRKVFACYPDDTVETLSQLEDFAKTKNLYSYEEEKHKIIGNAVELPLNFLVRENLNFSITQKEYFVPDENFTWINKKCLDISLLFVSFISSTSLIHC